MPSPHPRFLDPSGRALVAAVAVVFSLGYAVGGFAPAPAADAATAGGAAAKNVILFIGDGMSVATTSAARILDGQRKGGTGEENDLAWDRFPRAGLLKTYSSDFQTTDSAAGITAMVCGVKTKNGVLSCDARCEPGNVASVAESRVPTILEIAQRMGKSTGVVTTTRVTHATPAGCYGHTDHRGREADLAVQALDFPGGLTVLLGGGRAFFLPKSAPDPEGGHGRREDGRDLTAEWTARGPGWRYVWNREGFDAIDPASCDHLLGLFEASHCRYEADRAGDAAGEPSLSEMTAKAIDLLSRNPRGFVLMVEGGRIDHGHHGTNAYRALTETIELSAAVQTAADRCDPADTLILVTADHSHSFCMTGYARRGNPILGVVEAPGGGAARGADGLPYTVLAYGIGPVCRGVEGRDDLTKVDPTAKGFRQAAAYPAPGDTHSGEDVAIWARGAGSELLRGTMENTETFSIMRRAIGAGEK